MNVRLKLFLIIAATFLIIMNGIRCGSAQIWIFATGCYPPAASY